MRSFRVPWGRGGLVVPVGGLRYGGRGASFGFVSTAPGSAISGFGPGFVVLLPGGPTGSLGTSTCTCTSSIPAISRSASASSRRAGCTCSRRRRRANSAIRSSPTRRSSCSTPRRSSRATSSASASTRATRCAATKSAGSPRARRHGGLRRHSRDALSRRSRSSAARTRSSRATATSSGARRCATAWPALKLVYEGGKVDAGSFLPARWDLMPGEPLHVGVGADRARLPEALLVLLGVADRRPGAAPAHGRRGDGRDRRAAPEGLPLHRAGRRQLLSGGAEGSGAGGAARRQDAPARARGAARGALRVDGAAGEAAEGHDLLHADHDGSGRGPGVPRRHAQARTSRARSSASRR